MVGSTSTYDSWLVAASDRDKHSREYRLYIYSGIEEKLHWNFYARRFTQALRWECISRKVLRFWSYWRRSPQWGFSTVSPHPPCACWTRRMLAGARHARTVSTLFLDQQTGRWSAASSRSSGKEAWRNNTSRWYEPLH